MNARGSSKLDQFDWSEAREAELRTLWDEKLSAAQIGLRMHTTRNSIIGKAKRLGLAARKLGGPVKLATIGAHQCRWPLDPYDARHGFPSCGRKTDGGVYCGEHARKAFQQRHTAIALAKAAEEADAA